MAAEVNIRNPHLQKCLLRYAIFFAGSAVMGLFFVLPMIGQGSLRHPLVQSLSQWCCWGLLFPFIERLDALFPTNIEALSRRIRLHCAASFFITGIYIYLFFFMRALFADMPWKALKPLAVFSWSTMGWFLWSWLIYCVIAAGLQAIRYQNFYLQSELRAERLERLYAKARLSALRMQLDPHFLFNTLNTISAHVEGNPKLTRQMIEHLGDLLRLTLTTKDRQEIPLYEELSLVDHYLAIQKIRFGECLKIVQEIDRNALPALIPALTLQPLIENAIRHGLTKRVTGGCITLRIAAVKEQMHIDIIDDGLGLPSGWTIEKNAGVGLSTTRERIEALHPNGSGTLEIYPEKDGGTHVAIKLSLRHEVKNDE